MPQALEPILQALPKLTVTAVVDILAVAILIYQFLAMVRGRRAAHILTGFGVLVLVYLVAVATGLELLRAILENLASYVPIAIIVVFQSEIRRLLARLGRRRWLGFGVRLQRRESMEDILLAVEQLAEQKTGALIVLERDTGLRTFIESGVMLDAALSRDLLLAVFQPGGALHDGAVIIQGDRIAAAGCFLPLTMNPVLYRQLGTRHRAAIGVTEETDCMAIVVSEETARISVAAFGEIELDVTRQRVQERLNRHFGGRSKLAPRADATESSTATDTEWREAHRG